MQKNKFGAMTLAGSLVLTTPGCVSAVQAAQQRSLKQAVGMVVSDQKLGDVERRNRLSKTPGSGAMDAVDATGRSLGMCTLTHTDVSVQISGYVAGVTVEQVFENPYSESIEATYKFPLSNSSAVNEMTMEIGDRTIHGTIQKRDLARQTYNIARAQGHTASLLEQERTNIFTQSVANIPPHSKVKVKLKYVDILPYESGRYSFVFPMVVGPRYMPGSLAGHEGSGWSPDTSFVPDASKISPPIMAETTRAGHDISLKVQLMSGIQIDDIKSALHQIQISNGSANCRIVTLAPSDAIPNRDFVLSWQVAQNQIKSGCLAFKNGSEGYFNLMIVPPARPKVTEIAPRELNFIIDRSGSQRGLPLLKAKETMLYILDRLNKNDTFQILSFSNSTEKLFYQPMPPTREAIAKAKKYIANLEADGGTEMRHAVESATSAPSPDHRLRIFTIMTDGFIGNDNEIVSLVKKTRGVSRWFSFGTGNSVNRKLIDEVAKAGGGESQFVLLNSPGEQVAKEFFNRISSPLLTDISLAFDGVSVSHVLPASLNDVWAERPLYISGKYTAAGKGTVTVKGYSGGKPYAQRVALNLPEKETVNAVLPFVWARAKVDELMDTVHAGVLNPIEKRETQDQVEDLGLKYHILTDYTSFVAVDQSGQRCAAATKNLTVGVEAPDGVLLSGIFGQPKSPIPSGRIQLAPNVQTHPAQAMNGYNIEPSVPPPRSQSLALPEDIGKVVGPRDLNLFQVEPTVIDERQYTSGRAERHQNTKPTLPEGSPTPDTENPEFLSLMEASAADIIISTLGMPTAVLNRREAYGKLDAVMQRLLYTTTDTNKNIALDVEFSGARTALIAKLAHMHIKVRARTKQDNVGNQNIQPATSLTIDTRMDRIVDLARLEDVLLLSLHVE